MTPTTTKKEEDKITTNNFHGHTSPLSLTFEELARTLDGTGKAKACWDCFRMGLDPIWYYENITDSNNNSTYNNHNNSINSKEQPLPSDNNDNEYTEPIMDSMMTTTTTTEEAVLTKGWTRPQIRDRLAQTASRQSPSVLGQNTIRLLRNAFIFGSAKNDNNSHYMDSVEQHIATLSKLSTAKDGTTKLLLSLIKDQLQIEAVIIPWEDRLKSTLCVSSQVGCRQACTFCSTGRMGKLRNLSTSEIVAQLYWANKLCRLLSIYPIDNVVFMGMGEPADNIAAVTKAAQIMIDPNGFQLTPRKVTISTVAPTPESFQQLVNSAGVVLAWSVHSSRDDIRRQLVPTTQYSMEELRQGLLTALHGRSKRLRNIMLEVTLLDQINDSKEDAEHLAEFCRPLLENVKGIKLIVNLIPWNDISASFGPASAYRKPKMEQVLAYQNVLIKNGILTYIRSTRGDEQDAACGMLSTRNNSSMKQEH